MPEYDRLQDRLAALEAELAALNEINRALMNRVERSTDSAGSAFTLFESNIVLQQRVQERTSDLQQSNARLQDEIAEHKRTEAALRETQEKTRLMIDTALDAVIAFDRDWNVLDWNPRAESTFGYDQAYAINELSLGSLIAPGEYGLLRAYLDHLHRSEGRTLQTLELTARHRDGHGFPIELAASVVSDGAAPLYSAFIRDITERKQAEEARYRTLFDNSPVALLEADFSEIRKSLAALPSLAAKQAEESFSASPELLDTCVSLMRIVDVNQATVKLADAESREFYLANYKQIFKRAEPRLFTEGVSALARGATSFEIEAQMKTFKDRTIDLLINLSVAPGHNEAWSKILISAQDMTDRKRAEAEKAQLESQLRQTQKMETIGTLAGGIAHDFNNMLTPILGYADMIAESLDDRSAVREASEHIISAAQRARDLVRQILTFSRQVEQSTRPMLLAPSVQEALDLVRASLPSSAGMVVRFDPDAHGVMAEPTQIHQIVLNLCTNAYQALPQGIGTVEVELSNLSVDAVLASRASGLAIGEYVCLGVRDTGCGIEEPSLQRVFEPFYTTKEVGKGTGMGLSVTLGIVQKLGGAILVDSTPGVGSYFRVLLPAIQMVTTECSQIIVPSKTEGREHVLVVDDEPDVAQTTTRQLQKLGYLVTTLLDPLEALQRVQQAPSEFDVVITDQAMPKLPGNLLAEALRKIRPELPVLLLTGYNQVVGDPKLTASGIRAMLLKPVSTSDLSLALREVIEAPVH